MDRVYILWSVTTWKEKKQKGIFLPFSGLGGKTSKYEHVKTQISQQ